MVNNKKDKMKNSKKMIFNLLKSIVDRYNKSQCCYDYIILTTRRCFCIISALLKDKDFIQRNLFWIAKNKKVLLEIEQKMISSQKLDIVGNNFNNKNVLLVDDIMIHGQTVYNIYKRIKDYGAKEIDTLVLVRNIEFPDYYYFKTQKSYTSIYRKASFNWKEISNTFVKYLHNTNQMYISYIYGYEVKKQALDQILDKKEIEKVEINFSKFICHETYNPTQEPCYYNVLSFDQYKFLENMFLRIYPNCNDENQLNVVFYGELKKLKKSTINNIWNKIWITGNIPNELQQIKTPIDRFKCLTVIVSFIAYKTFFGCSEIKETSEIDKSYVKDFIKVIKDTVNDNALDIINNEYLKNGNDGDNYEQNTIVEQILGFDFSKENTDYLFKNIEALFYQISENEDKRFKENILDKVNSDRLPVNTSSDQHINLIETDYLYSKLPENKKSQCYAFLLYLLDNGIASHVVTENDNYVYTAIRAGEQSYHLFSDLTGFAFRPIFYFLRNINDETNLTELTEKKEKLIEALENENKFSGEELFSFKFVINHSSLNLDSNYFGILNEHVDYFTPEDIEKEKVVTEIVRKFL